MRHLGVRVALVLTLAFTVALLSACKDKAEQAAETARQARETAARQAEAAERKAAAARRGAEAAVDRAAATARDATGLARTVKAELDKVYKSERDYDLDITRTGASGSHAARLAAMPHVRVGDVTVGYEESASTSLHGIGYARHFRATWRRDGEDVIVSYATQEEIDAVAFAALVQKLVPIVEKQLH